MQSSVVLIPIINRCHHELPPFLKICLQNYSLPAHHKTEWYHLSTVFYYPPFISAFLLSPLCVEALHPFFSLQHDQGYPEPDTLLQRKNKINIGY